MKNTLSKRAFKKTLVAKFGLERLKAHYFTRMASAEAFVKRGFTETGGAIYAPEKYLEATHFNALSLLDPKNKNLNQLEVLLAYEGAI